MNLTAQITSDLYDHLVKSNTTLACLNSWIPRRWEMDIARVNKNKMLYEYEIKISRADFLADKKNKKNKHTLYASTKSARKDQENWVSSFVPSQFYYVCPTDLIKIEELPAFAGLIYRRELPMRVYPPYIKFDIVKRAPKIHNLKMPDKDIETLYHCMSWRLSTLLRKVGYENVPAATPINAPEVPERLPSF